MTPADLVKLARAAKSGKKVTSGLSAAKEAATISNMQQAGALPLSAAEIKRASSNVGLKIKPPSDNIVTVRQANFQYPKNIGNQTVSIDKISGGVRLSDPNEVKRVKALAEKIASPEGYISRIIVDHNNNVIEGQHRLEALRELGVKDVPVYKIEELADTMPVDKMEAAVQGVGAIHSDHVGQIVSHALEHISEEGIEGARQMNYGRFQKHYNAALDAIQSGSSPVIDRDANLANFLEGSATKERLYHATGDDFKSFAPEKTHPESKFGEGIYMTPNTNKANFFANIRTRQGKNAQVMPLYSSVKNPYEIQGVQNIPFNGVDTKKLKDLGYDGVFYRNDAGELQEVVAFEPTQVKSAIGNQGTYDVSEPDITKAQGGLIHMAGGGTPEPKRKSILDLTPLTEAAAAVQNAFKAERSTYGDKGAAMDILNRGIVADTLGGAADLANLPLQGLDWLQSKIPGLSKPASVMDVPSASPRLSDQPNTTLKFPLSTDAPFGGSEAWKELFKKSGVTSKTERPVAEISTSLLAPLAPAVASKAAKVAKAIAPRAGDLASQFAAKQAEAMGLPLELGIVPEGGAKLSKEEYAAMMREKYASQNVAKEAKRAVTFADIAPKEVKVPADDLGLYSPAQKAAANLKRNIGTGEAFLSDIKKAPDVTAEELKLSGVEDWLKSKKTASRQEVQDYMAENRPKLEESEYQQGVGTQDELKFGEGTVLDDDEYINSRADDIANDWDHNGWKSRDEIREEILNNEDPERAQYLVESGQIDERVNNRVYDLARQDAHTEYYENPYREFTNDLGYIILGNDDVGYSIKDSRGRDITPNRGVYDIETAEGVVQQHAMDNGIVNEGETKFHGYQLEGGDNYREIIIKAPDTKSGERNRLYEEINNEIYNIGHRSNYASPEQLLEDEKKLQELYEKRKNIYAENDKSNANKYKSSHWDEPNVVAHLRLQDRVDAEGKKVLYVDEMQSDWHQEGAEYGYKGADHEAQVKENRNAIANLRNQAEYLRAEKEDLITKLHEKHRDLGHVQILQLDEVKKYDADLLALKKQQDALSDEYKNLSNAVPEGPYKDNWHELALKRVMNYAAKNGYERVAFSSSKPQVGRWGTESIAFEKSEMGGDTPVWKVSATAQRGGRAGHIELEAEARARGILNEKQPEIIQSKDELREIVSAIAGRDWTNAKIDRVTNKTWKRMQEESVGVVEPRREGMEEFYDRTLGNSINKYAKKYKGKAGDTKVFEGEYNSATGKHYANGYEATGHPARYIDITPEMQKSLLKGQPMKRGGAVRMANGGAVTEGGSVPKAPSNWTDYLSQHAQEESMRLMGGDTALNPMKDGGSINLDDMIRNAVEKANSRNYASGGASLKNIESEEGLAPYGLRHSGEGAKGKGYFGVMPGKRGMVTELSTEAEGVGEHPLIVPTLTREELEYLLAGGDPTEPIYQKAYKHAQGRKSKGKGAFADPSELRHPEPEYADGGVVNIDDLIRKAVTLRNQHA